MDDHRLRCRLRGFGRGLTAINKWRCQTSHGRELFTLGLYVEKGEFGEISDLSTFVLDFLSIFFTAFASFFASFFATFFADLPFFSHLL